MGYKVFLKCGFTPSSLLPVKKKMYAANNEGINIMGAIFVRLSGVGPSGKTIDTAEMVYISDSTDLFYLSRHAMEQLQIIAPNFPQIGASCAIHSKIDDTAPLVEIHCECPKRTLPPPRPASLPFEPCDVNNTKMKQWLLDRFAASTFNKCPHQPLPMMSGPPISIHIDPSAKPTAVHTPAPIPVHWKEEVKKQLDADVALGVIEKVEPNTPTTWCHRAIWVRKADGSPRRVVDFQTLNQHCV